AVLADRSSQDVGGTPEANPPEDWAPHGELDPRAEDDSSCSVPPHHPLMASPGLPLSGVPLFRTRIEAYFGNCFGFSSPRRRPDCHVTAPTSVPAVDAIHQKSGYSSTS